MNKKYLLIETDDIKDTIKKNLKSNHLILIKSKKITAIEKFPLSNIILIPAYLSDKFVDIISNMSGQEFGIRKDQIEEVIKYTENMKLSDDLLNLIKVMRQS